MLDFYTLCSLRIRIEMRETCRLMDKEVRLLCFLLFYQYMIIRLIHKMKYDAAMSESQRLCFQLLHFCDSMMMVVRGNILVQCFRNDVFSSV